MESVGINNALLVNWFCYLLNVGHGIHWHHVATSMCIEILQTVMFWIVTFEAVGFVHRRAL